MTFPDPSGKEWIQIRDREGTPIRRVVALPVKDPYHIARCFLKILLLLRREIER
jgi:N-acylglucosamine 2-epimerase